MTNSNQGDSSQPTITAASLPSAVQLLFTTYRVDEQLSAKQGRLRSHMTAMFCHMLRARLIGAQVKTIQLFMKQWEDRLVFYPLGGDKPIVEALNYAAGTGIGQLGLYSLDLRLLPVWRDYRTGQSELKLLVLRPEELLLHDYALWRK